MLEKRILSENSKKWNIARKECCAHLIRSESHPSCTLYYPRDITVITRIHNCSLRVCVCVCECVPGISLYILASGSAEMPRAVNRIGERKAKAKKEGKIANKKKNEINYKTKHEIRKFISRAAEAKSQTQQKCTTLRPWSILNLKLISFSTGKLFFFNNWKF